MSSLQKRYDALLDLVKRDKDEYVFGQAYTIEELEQLIRMCWDDDEGRVSCVNRGELCKIFLNIRKQKLNEQFAFNQENILAICRIDEQLKVCCRQLKEDAESEIRRMLERKEKNENMFNFSIHGKIDMSVENSLLESSFHVSENLLHLLTFSITTNKKTVHPNIDNIEKICQLPIFDFTTNYAGHIGNNCMLPEIAKGFRYKELGNSHIGYTFYKLYRESFLSLQDIMECVSIHSGIRLRYGFSTYNKFSNNQKEKEDL